MALDLRFCFDIPDLHLIYSLLLTLARPDVVLHILNLRFSYLFLFLLAVFQELNDTFHSEPRRQCWFNISGRGHLAMS